MREKFSTQTREAVTGGSLKNYGMAVKIKTKHLVASFMAAFLLAATSPAALAQGAAWGGTSSSGIPFAPHHFGESPSDFSKVVDGVKAGDVFTGARLTLKTSASADELLPAAAGRKVLLSIGSPNPCIYWAKGIAEPAEKYAAFINGFIDDNLAKYKDRLIGLLLLNEPDNPDQGCEPVPPMDLYKAAGIIRPQLVAKGFPKDFPIGFGVAKGPMYFLNTVPADGTINLSALQYANQRGSLEAFMDTHLEHAADVGHKVYFTVNAARDGKAITSELLTICKRATPDRFLMVGYWKWSPQGGNQAVPLSDLMAVKKALATIR